jgi:hypothetical protein
VFEKLFKFLSIAPPSETSPPADHTHWRWTVSIWLYAVIITVAWGFGWTPLPFSPVGEVQAQVGELKSALVCSNLKTDLERIRTELYDVQREIETAPTVTETVRRRYAELQAALKDNETRYEKHGCYTIIG